MKKAIVNFGLSGGSVIAGHLNLFFKEIQTLRTLIVVVLILSFSMVGWSGTIPDRESIQGTWLPSAAEFAGMKFPDEIRKSLRMVIKGDQYLVTEAGSPDQGTLKLNPNTTPKQMDIISTDGANKGRTFLAIYELDGDTLRVCYDLSGNGRPTEFATKQGTKLFLVTYKLEKH